MKKVTAFLCVMVLVFGVVHQVLAEALFKGLGSLGSSGSFLSDPQGGISSDGKVVVGLSRDDFGLNHAFRWSESTGMVSIAGPDSNAQGVSSDGSVIVVNSGGQSFRWIEGYGLEPLGSPPGGTPPTGGRDVSGDGSIVVGQSNPISEGWVWEEGQGFTNLGRGVAEGVSDDGIYVTGVTVDDAAGVSEAFIWSEVDGMTTLGFLPDGGWSSYGNDISADGSTVVGTGWISGGYEAFRWTEETGMEGLGDLPGGFHSSIPNAVSGDGSIVVGEGSSGTPNGAFIWELGTGMRSLAEVLQNDFGLNLNGWVLWSAKGISSDGKTIVGDGKNPLGQSEAWIAYLDTKITIQCSDFAGKWSGSWSETNCDGINYSGTWTSQVYSDCQVIGTLNGITVTGTIDPSTGIFTGTGTSEGCGSITLDGDFIEDSVTGSYSYSSGGGGSFIGSLQSTNDGGDGGGGGGGG